MEVAGRPGGPEAAAREARYQALAEAARQQNAVAVLTGHTRDDQAETVLLALARGAGPRGLAGMPARRDLGGVPLLRPLLEISREQTRAACAVLGLSPWQDPHNTDPSYARSRVRADLLPALVRALGPGVVDNLARTARLVAADNAALDELAGTALAVARCPDGGLSVPALLGLVPAVRGRVLHSWARELGALPGALSASARRRAGRPGHRLARSGSGRPARRCPGAPPGRPVGPRRPRLSPLVSRCAPGPGRWSGSCAGWRRPGG